MTSLAATDAKQDKKIDTAEAPTKPLSQETVDDITAAAKQLSKDTKADKAEADKDTKDPDKATADDKNDVPSSESQEDADKADADKDKDDDEDKDDADATGQTDDRTQEAEDELSGITDAHLERAVKAGMTIADAKTFQDAEALDRVITMLEDKKKDDGVDGDADAGSDADEDLLKGIPDLDPEDYDENVVAGFKALKGIIGSLQATIKGLQTDSAARNTSWFDTQVAGLGKEASETLKTLPAKLQDLKDKFDVLSVGYKSSGKSIDQGIIFKEAVAVVLGDVEAKAASAVKADELKKRKAKHVSRPADSSTVKKAGDVFENVAETVHEKFFKKSA